MLVHVGLGLVELQLLCEEMAISTSDTRHVGPIGQAINVAPLQAVILLTFFGLEQGW
jgi:hypothetical protein